MSISNGLRLFEWTRGRSAEPPTKLVVGLGNPGPKYASTRHNAGFRVVEQLAMKHAADWRVDADLQARCCEIEVAGQRIALLEPQTFMNRSGASVAAALGRWNSIDPSADLLIVYDDLDLPTGRIRLRPKGGAGGHNGMKDILQALDAGETRAVPRLRFGIGHPGSAGSVLDWVLGAFEPEEEEQILPEALEAAAEAVEVFAREGIVPAMGRFNASK